MTISLPDGSLTTVTIPPGPEVIIQAIRNDHPYQLRVETHLGVMLLQPGDTLELRAGPHAIEGSTLDSIYAPMHLLVNGVRVTPPAPSDASAPPEDDATIEDAWFAAPWSDFFESETHRGEIPAYVKRRLLAHPAETQTLLALLREYMQRIAQASDFLSTGRLRPVPMLDGVLVPESHQRVIHADLLMLAGPNREILNTMLGPFSDDARVTLHTPYLGCPAWLHRVQVSRVHADTEPSLFWRKILSVLAGARGWWVTSSLAEAGCKDPSDPLLTLWSDPSLEALQVVGVGFGTASGSSGRLGRSTLTVHFASPQEAL